MVTSATKVWCIGVVVSAGAALAAQPVPIANPHHLRLRDVLGAKVEISAPAAPTPRETRGDRHQDREVDGKGGRTGEAEAARRPTRPAGPDGEVTDLLFAHRTGSVECVVVALRGEPFGDGKTVALPAARLRPLGSGGFRLADVPLTTLQRLQGFDPENARATRLADHVATILSDWSAVGLIDGDERGGGEATSQTTGTTPLPASAPAAVEVGRASELLGRTVFALDGEFGTIGQVIVDWNGRTLAYGVVTRSSEDGGRRDYLVPWRALAWTEQGSSVRLAVSLTSAQIENAGIDCDASGTTLVDPAVAERSKKLFQRGDG